MAILNELKGAKGSEVRPGQEERALVVVVTIYRVPPVML